MSLLKKFKKMLLGSTTEQSQIKVTEISSGKTSKERTNVKNNAPKKQGEFKKERTGDSKPRRERNASEGESDSQRQPRRRDENSRGARPQGEGKERRERSQGGEGRDRRERDGYRSRNGGAKRRRKKGTNQAELAGLNAETAAVDFGNWTVEEFQVPEAEGKTRFHDFEIPPRAMRGIAEAGYQYCTPIQSLILTDSFKGTDVSGKAQTGTGKTAAFLITVFKRLLDNPIDETNRRKGSPRALIMAPTRELVIQIEKDAKVLGKYCGFNFQSVFGGINYERQRRQLVDRNIDILVATPGRLLDFQEQSVLHLDQVEILVIDEADRMLDMGFIPDMKKIISATPPKSARQTMLFSATLTQDILRLANQWTKNALNFEVESTQLTADKIDQRAYIVTNQEKFALMYNMIENEELNCAIVFGNRRDEVSKLTDMFREAGITCGLLSGDVSQARRIRTLEDLRAGKIRVLCATDVAARGIHVDGVTHVFNFSLPDDPEDYVHRIGRTGRAGASGVSIIFATEEDSYVIPRIEKFISKKLNYTNPEEELVTLPDDIAQVVTPMKHFARRRGAPKPKGDGGGRRGGSNNRRKPSGGGNGGGGNRRPSGNGDRFSKKRV